MNERLRRLLEARATLVGQARAYLEAHSAEWSEEREAAYSAMMADMDTQTAEIRRIEHLLAIETENRQSQGREVPPSVPPTDGDGDPAPEQRRVTATPEYRAAWETYLRTGDQRELRAMNISVDPAGGYLVADEMHNQMVFALNEYLPFRNYATVIPTGGDRSIPIGNQDGEAYWTGEQERYTEDDEAVAQKVLGGHKLTRLQKVSEELVQDSAFDISGFLGNAFALAFSAKEEAAFTTGTGVGRPTGFILDAQVGKTAAYSNIIQGDEIIDLFYSLKAPYRRRAAWQMADSSCAAVSKMKDSNGQYLWQPSLQVGQPDTLKGRPVLANNSMAAIASGAKTVAFGDFSFYWIAERGQPIIQRLLELYAETGQIGYRMARRIDGKLVIPEAVKVLVQGTGAYS
jgi:HK97 family phage major capsid protein